MILTGAIDLLFALLRGAFAGFEIIGLPLQFINTLQTILVYGVWIVGADVIAIFTTTIIAWWTIKLVVGLIVWLWELVPFT